MTKPESSPVTHVGVHEAKSRLSELLRLVDAGGEVVICRGREPVARLVSARTAATRTFGHDRGRFQVPDDFDTPLPPDVLRDFEG